MYKVHSTRAQPGLDQGFGFWSISIIWHQETTKILLCLYQIKSIINRIILQSQLMFSPSVISQKYNAILGIVSQGALSPLKKGGGDGYRGKNIQSILVMKSNYVSHVLVHSQ